MRYNLQFHLFRWLVVVKKSVHPSVENVFYIANIEFPRVKSVFCSVSNTATLILVRIPEQYLSRGTVTTITVCCPLAN